METQAQVQEKSLRVYDTKKTFFTKIGTTFSKIFAPTKIGFNNLKISQKVLNVSKSIDIYCHSKEDNYMMQFLAKMQFLKIQLEMVILN